MVASLAGLARGHWAHSIDLLAGERVWAFRLNSVPVIVIEVVKVVILRWDILYETLILSLLLRGLLLCGHLPTVHSVSLRLWLGLSTGCLVKEAKIAVIGWLIVA